MSKDLLTVLTESRHLPAFRDDVAEPREPNEPSEITTRGRSPDEVVQPREQFREPAEREPEIETVDGKRYGATEVKKIVDAVQAAMPQQPQPPVQITNSKIAQVYDPYAGEVLADLIAKGLVDSDLYEAWPRTVQTMVGQLRFAFDVIFEMREELAQTTARLNQTLQFLHGQQFTPKPKRRQERQDKRYVIGERGGVVPAPVDPNRETLLDRMIDRSHRLGRAVNDQD
jgi:hypothetical protein